MVFKFYQLSSNEELILVDNNIGASSRVALNNPPQRIVHNCDGSIQIRRGENDQDNENHHLLHHIHHQQQQQQRKLIKKRLSIESTGDEHERSGVNDETILLNSTQQCSQCSSTSSSSTSATTSAYFSCSDSTNYNAWADSSKFDDDDDDLDDDERSENDEDDLDKFNSCSIIVDDDDDDDDDESATNSLLKIVHKNNDRSSGSFKTDLILSLCSQIDTKYTNVNKRRRVTTCGDQLKFNRTFWSYVLNKLGLLSILNNGNNMRREHSRTVEQLQISIDRLIATLNRLESELANYIVDHVTFNNSLPVVFDTEFVLNLAFLLFEQAVKLTETSSSRSSETNPVTLVFELDIDVSTADYSFEVKLNELMSNWVLVYLPSMIDRVIRKSNEVETSLGNGKSIIDFFECLFKSKTFQPSSPKRIYSTVDSSKMTNNTENFFYDIEQDLNAPHFDSERGEFEQSNPLSRSFSVLADNLVRLNYYSTDPSQQPHHQNHYHHEFNHYINSSGSQAFGYLLASYYTMGAFELRSVLFENTCQPLHEAKMFEQECARVFYDYEHNHHNQKKKNFADRVNEAAAAAATETAWSYSSSGEQTLNETWSSPSRSPKTSFSSPPSMSKKKSPKDRLLIDEIVERVAAMTKSFKTDSSPTSPDLNTSKSSTKKTPCKSTSSSTSTSPNDSGGGGNCSSGGIGGGGGSSGARSWTVAPKLYPVNFVQQLDSTHHTHHSNPHSVAMCDKRVSSMSRVAESRPIGTKPISMLSRGSNNYRNNINNVSNNKCAQVRCSSSASSSMKKCRAEFVCDTTWRQETTAMSPFVMYANSTSLTDGGFNINERIDLKKLIPSSTLNIQPSSSYPSANRSVYNNQQHQQQQMTQMNEMASKTRRYSVAPFFMLDHHYNQAQQQQQQTQQQQQHTVYNYYKHPLTASQYNNQSARKSSLCYQPSSQQPQQQQHHHIPPSLSMDNAIVSVSMTQPSKMSDSTQQHHHQVAYSNSKIGYTDTPPHRRGSVEETIANTYKYSSNLKTNARTSNNSNEANVQRTRYK